MSHFSPPCPRRALCSGKDSFLLFFFWPFSFFIRFLNMFFFSPLDFCQTYCGERFPYLVSSRCSRKHVRGRRERKTRALASARPVVVPCSPVHKHDSSRCKKKERRRRVKLRDVLGLCEEVSQTHIHTHTRTANPARTPHHTGTRTHASTRTHAISPRRAGRGHRCGVRACVQRRSARVGLFIQ